MPMEARFLVIARYYGAQASVTPAPTRSNVTVIEAARGVKEAASKVHNNVVQCVAVTRGHQQK